MTYQTSLFPAPPDMPDIKPDMRVGFILSPRFTLLSFASFIDALRHAADEADFSRQIYCHWKIIAPSLQPVTASCGVEVCPQETFPDPREFDYIVVVGGQLPWCLEQCDEITPYLRTAYAANVSIVGLCTGSFLLAQAGLLDGRHCAIHTAHLRQMQSLFPKVLADTDRIYANDDEIFTCPGGTAALDLAFALIGERCGRARAIKGLRALLLDAQRTARHVPHRPFGHLVASGNRKVEQAAELMEGQIAAPHSIATLARQLNTSARELNRLFTKHAGKPPAAVWRDMRLDQGHWLLLNSTRTVTQIALECGFADGAHFCRWFKRTYGETPRDFRNRRREVWDHQ